MSSDMEYDALLDSKFPSGVSTDLGLARRQSVGRINYNDQMDSDGGRPKQPSARAEILGITAQVPVARALAVVVETGIADQLGPGPQSPEQLAKTLNLKAGPVRRLLRMLSARGIFFEDVEGRFRHTDQSRVLMRDDENTVAALLRLPWQDIVWKTYLEMPHTLLTGEPAFEAAHGASFFDYLAANPDANSLFDAGMAMISGPEDLGVAAAYDFGQFDTVVDVGGGRGGLLFAILERHPAVRGLLFDQPQVLDSSLDLPAGVDGRLEKVAGDFFVALPEGGAFILKRILHDWDDEEALRLLRTCAGAMSKTSRLLVAETLLKPPNEPDPGKDQDVGMMLLTRGRERDLDEYQSLFGRAGLELVHVHPTGTAMSIIEARRSG